MYKLLICDDEALERTALRKMIEKRYPDITLIDDAKTGGEAITAVHRFLPDIMLVDIKMPELNGLEAQKKIIEFHPAIKTVIITAYSDFSYAQEAIKYNIFDFLLKPVPPVDLYACIDKILGQLQKETDKLEKKEQEVLTAVQRAIAYIDAHCTKGLRIGDVAERVNLSEKYFSRYFKQQTGLSFTDYLNLRLIKKSKDLLIHTKYPIYNIAIELNFSDAAYFTKVFRRYEKVTPSQYRQKYSK
jgi:Response regulator containing CheY-like receiver domain and AraC-type DNA-binding domain